MPFSNVLGQERAKRFLSQVMAREKIPHAYLFTGIPGIGKTTTAIALAMALNCRLPEEGEACGRCVSCRQMKNGNFPDFVTIGPIGQNIRIDQVRDFQRILSFAPVSGRYRVSVIHHAETMTAEAANAFLKTLEEPPPGNILILNSTESFDLLPTIVSRCQRVPFQPLPVKGMVDWLGTERGLNAETAAILAMMAGGSLGRALSIYETGFIDKRQKWLLNLISLPRLSKEEAFEMALECEKKIEKTGLDVSGARGGDLTDMLAVWETWYRDLLLLKVEGPEHLIINADFSRELKNTSGNFERKNLWQSIYALDKAQRDLRQMRNTKLVLEHTVLSLNRLAGAVN